MVTVSTILNHAAAARNAFSGIQISPRNFRNGLRAGPFAGLNAWRDYGYRHRL